MENNRSDYHDRLYPISMRSFERPHHLRSHLLDKMVEFTGTLHEVRERASFLAPLSRSCLVNVKSISQIDLRKRKVIFVTGQSESFSK